MMIPEWTESPLFFLLWLYCSFRRLAAEIELWLIFNAVRGRSPEPQPCIFVIFWIILAHIYPFMVPIIPEKIGKYRNCLQVNMEVVTADLL